MDKLVADLLTIEQRAIESMEELEGEQAAQARLTAEEITHRTLEIKRNADMELQALKQEAEENTQAQLAQIEQNYQQKASQLQELFDTNAAIWRKAWVNRILEIES